MDGVQGSPLVEITRHCKAPFMAIESNQGRIVAIEGMIANLSDYRETEHNHAMRGTFRAVTDRLGVSCLPPD